MLDTVAAHEIQIHCSQKGKCMIKKIAVLCVLYCNVVWAAPTDRELRDLAFAVIAQQKHNATSLKIILTGMLCDFQVYADAEKNARNLADVQKKYDLLRKHIAESAEQKGNVEYAIECAMNQSIEPTK